MPELTHTGAVVVLTTLDSDADAVALVRTLIDERLVACAGVLPGLTSVYRWEGAVEQVAEQQLVLKTTRGQLSALEVRVHELHPFDVPEFVVLDVGASRAYGAWLAAETTPREE